MNKITYMILFFLSIFLLALGFFYGIGNFLNLSVSRFDAFSLALTMAIVFTIFRKTIKKSVNKIKNTEK